VIITKRILAFAAMILLISTCYAVYTIPDISGISVDDTKWTNLLSTDSQIIASDVGLIATAVTDEDLVQTKKYCEYLKSDASNSLNDSAKCIVSKKLQSAKDYYERGLKEVYNGATELIEGINLSDMLKIKRGATHIQEGDRYAALVAKEMNAVYR
jgi:hypothetical protein